MTEFKAGDRVKVEFEGVATHPLDGYGNVCVSAMGRTQWYPVKYVTKLHDPLPTKDGAVIRIPEQTSSLRILEYSTPRNVWWGAGSSTMYEAAAIEKLVEKCGFTVLYAGDDE